MRRDEERGGERRREEERVRSGIARDSEGIVTRCVLRITQRRVTKEVEPETETR